MTDPRNPYSPPTVRVADRVERPDPVVGGTLVPNGRRLAADRGAGWIGDAWRLFRAWPGKWLLATLLLLLIYVVASVLPLSSIVTAVVWPFIAAGIVMAADQQRRTGTFELGTLFGGFGKQRRSLLMLGGVAVLMVAISFVLLAIAVGPDVAAQITLDVGGEMDPERLLSANYVLGMLIYFALMLLLSAAMYLAPPLIVLNGLPAGTAMKMSFVSSFKNVLAGLVFSLCAAGLIIASIIPIGLGLFVSLPVLMLTTYTVYRDIFIEERAATSHAP